MVQESIVEYINSQMRTGVSRDAIKATLTGAGWQAADVEDTLKKVEASKSPAAQPMTAMPAQPVGGIKPMASAPSTVASSAPQTIKVSDLVSASPSSASITSASKPLSSSPISSPATASRSPLTGPAVVTTAAAAGATKSSNTFPAQTFSAAKPHGSRGPLITDIVLIIVILIVGGFAGFLFMQNGSLTSKLASLNGQSSGVNSQLSALQAQVAASTTALTAQVGTLTAETQELQTELSFYAAPSDTTPGATTTASFSGTVSGGGKTSYVITAMYGGKIYVANSKSASVISAMAALTPTSAATATSTASSTTASSTASASATPSAPVTAQFTGTYVPGSDSITLTSVNGTSL